MTCDMPPTITDMVNEITLLEVELTMLEKKLLWWFLKQDSLVREAHDIEPIVEAISKRAELIKQRIEAIKGQGKEPLAVLLPS